MANVEERIREILAARGGFSATTHGYEPLIAALLKTDSVAKTLADFGWDPLATAPLTEELLAALRGLKSLGRVDGFNQHQPTGKADNG